MMDISRRLLHERQIALIQHYLERLSDLYQMHTHGQTAAQEALRAFDMEWRQFQAQQQWAAAMALKDARAAALVALFPDTAKTLLMQLDVQAAIRWLEDALQWAGTDDLPLRYRLLLQSYELYRVRLNLERAREILDEAETLADRLNDDHRRVEVVRLKAAYYGLIEDHASQLVWSEHALNLAIRLEDQEQIASAYHKLGFACIFNDQYSRADEYLNHARRIFQQLGMRLNEGYALNGLASNAYYWGKYDQVVTYGEAALAIVREFGRREAEQVIFTNLALFMTGTAYLEKGLHYAQQALAMAVNAHVLDSELRALGILLLACANLGLVDELRDYVSRAQAHLSATPQEALQSTVEWVLWHIAHEQADWQTACHYAEQMVLAARSRDNTQAEHSAVGGWGNSLVEMGEFDAAADAYLRGLELRDASFENPQERANNLAGLSYVRVQQQRMDAGQTLFDAFFALMSEHSLIYLDMPFMLAWNAYRAAKGLDDPRLEMLLEQIKTLLDTYLEQIQDERLRTSFLNQYSLRCLLGLRSNTSN